MANDKIQQINRNIGSIEYKLMSCEDKCHEDLKKLQFRIDIIFYTQVFINA